MNIILEIKFIQQKEDPFHEQLWLIKNRQISCYGFSFIAVTPDPLELSLHRLSSPDFFRVALRVLYALDCKLYTVHKLQLCNARMDKPIPISILRKFNLVV